MSIEELSNRLEMFKKGFESITNNLSTQLQKVEAEVNQLVENTIIIPKIKDSNKEIFQKLQNISGVLGELIFRLDQLSSM